MNPQRPPSPARRAVRRRQGLGLGAAAVLVTVLAACGGDSAAEGSSASTSGDASGSAGTSATAESGLLPPAEGIVEYPLTLETQWGDVVLEQRPERVVAGDDWELDLLAALGVTPVGTNDQDHFRAYATKLMPAPIETTWSNDDVAFPSEAIAATQPDLIDVVGSLEEPDNLDELSSIAPVLGPAPSAEDIPPWEERLRLLGEALDLTERAEEAIAENDAYFEQVRADHPEFADMTAVFINFWGGGVPTGYLSTPGSGSYDLLGDLGFAPNPDSDRFTENEELSPELVGSIEADVILVNDGSGSVEELEEFLSAPLFQGLEAVQAGRLVVTANPEQTDVTHEGQVVAEGFGHFGRAIGGSGPVPQQAITEFLVPLLAEAVAP